jgi:hypothetical protein
MSSIQVTARRVNIKPLVTYDERKLKIFNSSGLLENGTMDSQPIGNREKNLSTHVNEERPFGLGQMKSKFASIRFGKSNIQGFIATNSHYLNRILVKPEIEIEVSFFILLK